MKFLVFDGETVIFSILGIFEWSHCIGTTFLYAFWVFEQFFENVLTPRFTPITSTKKETLTQFLTPSG